MSKRLKVISAAVIILALVFVGCVPAQRPADVVKGFCLAMDAGDVQKAKKYLHPDLAKALTNADVQSWKEHYGSGVKRIDVKQENVSKNNSEAEVGIWLITEKANIAGLKQNGIGFYLIKHEGKWKIYLFG